MVKRKVANLILVDDHTLFRDGLRELISHWDEFQVVGEAANGEEAVALCQKHLPDIVLMDIQMPVMNGVEATRIIQAEFPAIDVVILTMSMEEFYLFEAIKQGARGYILKTISADHLRKRLHEVICGESPLSAAIATRILAEFNQQQTSHKAGEICESLSKNEIQILLLLAEGLTNDDIGNHLSISGQVVRKQIRNLLQKLHLNNRVQAAVYAVRKGLDK